MKKSLFRSLVLILILSLLLPAVTTNGQAEKDLPPSQTASVPNFSFIEALPEKAATDNKPATHSNLPTELAEGTALREYIALSPDVVALTQQQVQNFDCASVVDVPRVECEALVAFYASTNGAGWDYSNWLISPTIGDWYGVTVTDGHVTQLYLFADHLIGTIPAEMGILGYLETLFLTGNQLSGSIPPELGNLNNLEDIYLNDNQLSGSIPPEIGNLSDIRELSLSNNQLSGPIPPELGNLTNLESLNLSANQLSGFIPPELGSLTNLESLNLSVNQLSGFIPPELGNLTNLQSLNLSVNQLSGFIPPELGDLSKLRSLDLFINQLSGSIPSELGNLSLLEYITLSHNQLNGSIPPELGNLSNLQQLSLTNNQLSGPIPPELGNLIYLEYLYLNENQLSGSIPSQLGNLSSFIFLLDLSFNQLSGSIPPELGNMSSLAYLFLNDNQLNGSIPPELGDISSLRHLTLSENQLSGAIPPEMGDLINLWGLDLGDNKLSGDVPASFTNLVNLCGPGDTEVPCSDESYELNLGYNHLNVPATEPVASFLDIKDPDWYLTQAVEEDIPSQTGGALVSIDGNVQIDVPMGAVSGTLTLLFAPHSKPSKGTGVLSFAGNSFDLTASVDGTPVSSFAKPLTLTLHYDDGDLSPISEDRLNLYTWDSAASAWVDAVSFCDNGTYTRNLDENWLSLPICHLSEFALLVNSFDVFLPAISR